MNFEENLKLLQIRKSLLCLVMYFCSQNKTNETVFFGLKPLTPKFKFCVFATDLIATNEEPSN
jgi:DNA-binding protein Fis